jgi:photosystem II stability/assembly factor-like uncharacterized protein
VIGARSAQRTCLLAAAAVFFACLALSAALTAVPARAADAAPAWTEVAAPDAGAWVVRDVSCFGETGIAAAGDGHVAVSRDGGGAWRVSVPGGYQGTVFTSAAFNTTGNGVVASGGLLLVTGDWGATWAPPAFIGSGPTEAIQALAMRGKSAVAVGAEGMILASSDGGATWQSEASPVRNSLTSVALAAGGVAVAGSDAGEVLVRRTSWAVAGYAGAPITSVGAASPVTWGDGSPDLFAATAHSVLGSDDGASFTVLPGLPDLSGAAWPEVAWSGDPDRSVVVAGRGEAGFLSSKGVWWSGTTGISDPIRAAAPGGQSVAYLLDAGGRLVRTFSAGREPASAKLSKSRVPSGSSTRLSVAVNVAAPGAVVVRSRVPGGPWSTVKKIAWTASDGKRSVGLDLSPTLNHDYAVQFTYGGVSTSLAPVMTVTAVPKVKVTRTRYALRKGAVFRFSGSVSPQLKGEQVELLTDRGGGWRPVSLQRTVTLRDGRVWESRKFGTPKAETYHLRARLAKTGKHAEALSPVVTVSVR